MWSGDLKASLRIATEKSINKTSSIRHILLLTLNSKTAIPIPEAAAVPANPIKCPEPILLANNEAPTWEQNKALWV